MGEKRLSLSSVAKGARRAVEKPGTILDALSEARCAMIVTMCPHSASTLASPSSATTELPVLTSSAQDHR